MGKISLLGLCLIAGLSACGGGSSSSPLIPGLSRTFASGGSKPEGIAIDASDNVWVANRYSNAVAELSNDGSLIATFPVGDRPHGIKIDRSHTGNVWVQNTAGGGPGAPVSCPNSTSGTVTALTPSGSLIGTFCTNGNEPQHAQFDSVGNIWVTNEGSDTVAELTAAGALVDTFGTGVNPHAIAIDQSGNFWIGNHSSADVTVLKPSGAPLGTIANAGQQPSGNSIDPSGNLWQAIQGLDTVAVFAAAPSLAPIKSEPVGMAPRGVTIDKGGNVFIANQTSNDVTELDPSGTQTNTFQVGDCPENMGVDSKGNLWVTNACSDTVTELRGVAVATPGEDDDSDG